MCMKMDAIRSKIFLVSQAVLCALVAVLLITGALSLFFDGTARQAEGDLFYYIYTRERVWDVLLPILPFFFLALGVTAAGLILGVKDEKAQKPVRDPRLLPDPGSLGSKAAPLKSGQKTRILRTVVLVIAVVLLVIGILNGGLEEVFMKGATICSECIGLG